MICSILCFSCEAQDHELLLINKNSRVVKKTMHDTHPAYKMLNDSLNKYNDKHLTFVIKNEPTDSLGIVGYSFYFNSNDICNSIRVITKEDSYDKIIFILNYIDNELMRINQTQWVDCNQKLLINVIRTKYVYNDRIDNIILIDIIQSKMPTK